MISMYHEYGSQFGPDKFIENERAEVRITSSGYDTLNSLSEENNINVLDLSNLGPSLLKTYLHQKSLGRNVIAGHPDCDYLLNITSDILDASLNPDATFEAVNEDINELNNKLINDRPVSVVLDRNEIENLIDIEHETKIESFDLHYNHSLVVMKETDAKIKEGWFVAGYNFEQRVFSPLVFEEFKDSYDLSVKKFILIRAKMLRLNKLPNFL